MTALPRTLSTARLTGALLLGTLLSAPALAATAQSGGAPQSREQAALVEEQDLLARKLARVVASMNRLAERFEAEGRVHAANLLRDGLRHISERHEGSDGLTLEERMTGSHEKLRTGQSMQSIETQQRIIGELEALISILMDRPDLEQLETEIEKLQRQRQELDALASAEEKLREETEALRQDASNEAQEALEAGIEQARQQQRELLAQNEKHGRQSGALDLERLEQALEALARDQGTDAAVLEDWDPTATGSLEEAAARLAQARRAAEQQERLQEAARALRGAAEASAEDTPERSLEERAEAARRAARASGDEGAERAAEALREAAESLRQAGEDEEARAAASARVGELADELEAGAQAAGRQASAEREEAGRALESLEDSPSGSTRDMARELGEALESAEPAGAPPDSREAAQENSEAARATEEALRAVRDALEQNRFLGQALSASQEENAERAERLREGVERLPQDLGAEGERAEQALNEAREAMARASQQAEGGQSTESARSARQAEEALREASEALARGRENQAAQEGSSPSAEMAEAQEELARQVDELNRLTDQGSLGEEAQDAVRDALQQASEAMQQASQEMSRGQNASAAQTQRQAGESLREAAEQARDGVEPQTAEERARAEELAQEQERIEKELYEFQQRYEEESDESSPELPSLDQAQQSAAEARQSLEQGDLDRAQEQEQQAQEQIQQAMNQLQREEEQYQKLREEELLFQIAEEVASILEAHEAAMAETREVDAGREPGKRASRGQKLRLRKISRNEAALAERTREIGAAIREEGSLVFGELIERIERDLDSVARHLSDQGGYRSDERVQALQADVSHYLGWLAEALEEERERREEEQQQQQEGQPNEQPQDGENRLVPDVAELKLLSRMEVDVLDGIEELLVLYPELEQGGEIEPLLLEEIQRLAYRHERSTELFREFRKRLGIEAPLIEVDQGGGSQAGDDDGDTEE